MHDPQNSHHINKDPRIPDDAQSSGDKNELPSRSYYYDDSTGYEVYDEESETAEQGDSEAEELKT
jgi:hypothetical protein